MHKIFIIYNSLAVNLISNTICLLHERYPPNVLCMFNIVSFLMGAM